MVESGTLGRRETLPLTALFVLIGAQPRTEWLPSSIARDAHGFVLTGPRLAPARGNPSGPSDARPRHMHETSVPGVFAVGDVRHGSVKRVASAVGDGGVVVNSVHHYLATRTR